MRVRIPVLLFLVAASAFAQLPLGEFPIAEDRGGVAPTPEKVLIAASREQFLVAWRDDRVGGRLRASRVLPGGEIRDPDGFFIDSQPRATPSASIEAVASDGANFLVVSREGAGVVRLHRVTPDGVATRLPAPNVIAERVSIAWTGKAYALFFRDAYFVGTGRTHIQVVMIDAEGLVIGKPLVAVESIQGFSGFAAASSGSGVVLAWTEISDATVRVRLFGIDALLAGEIETTPAAPRSSADGGATVVSLASDGNGYLLAWASESGYRARPLDSGGQPSGPAVVLGATTGALLTWDGSRYRTPAAGRPALVLLGRDGAETGEIKLAPSGTNSIVACAVAQGRTLIAWGGLLTIEIGGVRTELSRTNPVRSRPTAVWAGDHYRAAWVETTDIRCVVTGRLSRDGRPLDGAGIPVGCTHSANYASPILATDGRGSAVVIWYDGFRYHLASIGADGSVIAEREYAHANTLYLPLWPSDPVIRWNGTSYLAAFAWRIEDRYVIAGVRIRADGTFVDAEPHPLVDTQFVPHAIGWNAPEYEIALVAGENLWSSRATAELFPIGSPLKLATLTIDPAGAVAHVGASNGGLLVVWPQGAIARTLRGLRISRDGLLLDPLGGFEIGPSSGSATAVVGNGDGWIVIRGHDVWTVARDGRVSAKASYDFVPKDEPMTVVHGGPAPLVLYHRPARGGETSDPLVARFAVPRQRATR